ncbi:glycosyltransferase family 2 protein [Vibrio pacinii]|uniref:glycosyltransferase family 2 protein n=1 Tax=Vibrio pacinii TaxID=170674 RepID=UPI00056FF398|nr:glycosyltransferase family 2 protein [Vibrio pacinii]
MKKFLGVITRCKDEFFIKEFVQYYLDEGVDYIYIIDDNSRDKSIYKDLNYYDKVSVIYDSNIIEDDKANRLYQKIKNKFEWIAYLDVDEFVVPKKNQHNTIVRELKENFNHVDCIKIPWVMMSSGGRVSNPDSVLRSNVWRWDHDKKHPNNIHKFRCRYESIEVKCIFRTDKFDSISHHHHPSLPRGDVKVVDSINIAHSEINSYYDSLREKDIISGHLVCYHYRMVSTENNKSKLRNNKWYKDNLYSLEDLEKSDHAEIFDNTLSVRNFRKKIFIIGFNRVATRSLHYLFLKNGLASVHWDNNNLAGSMWANLKKGRKLLSNGEVVNKEVNSPVKYSKAQVFSDITFPEHNLDAKDFYKFLDNQYPDSLFILNVRNVEDWIRSRNKHSKGKLVRILTEYHGVCASELEEIWRTMWLDTIDDMHKYFSGRSDFLVFDIDCDDGNKLKEFFSKHFVLDASSYDHIK